jgi:hypothetical protein
MPVRRQKGEYMKDYEPVAFPSVGNPSAGMLCMTVSESRVGLFMPVLEALDRPDWIQIHRRVGKKEREEPSEERKNPDRRQRYRMASLLR